MNKKLIAMVIAAGAMLGNGALAGISFGDTYAFEKLGSSNWGDRSLLQSCMGWVYTGDAAGSPGYCDQYVLFEVCGAGSKDEIRPVVENLGFQGALEVSVWTDGELLAEVMPPLSTKEDWEYEGSWADSRETGDISGSFPYNANLWTEDLYYEYDDSDGIWHKWPTDMWPDGRAVAGRFWVAVKCSAPIKNRWYGMEGSIRVWQQGTGVRSEQFYICYSSEDAWPFTSDASGLFRGLTIDSKFRALDVDMWDPYLASYDTPLHEFWLPWKNGDSLSISLPEAGIFYMSSGWYENIEQVAEVMNADEVKVIDVNPWSWMPRDNDGTIQVNDPEVLFFEHCAGTFSQPRYISAKVNSARTIALLLDDDDDDDYDFSRLQFYPSSCKSVAVEASFFSIFDKNRYPRRSDQVGEYLQGYVTGTGVYKVGETVAVTAVPAPGEAFDHWELKYGNFPSGINTNSPTLNFTVTDECAGTAEERKQMVVRAVWKAKRQIVATTENVSQGIASGSGFYHDGASVTLTAQPAAGFEFAGWSDGVKTATRKVSVSGDAEYVALFDGKKCHVTFNANGGVGTMAEQISEIGSPITLNGCAFSKTGFTFVQWKGSDGKTYSDGQTVTLSDDLALTAQWKWSQPGPSGAVLTVNDDGILIGADLGDATEIAIPEGVTAIGAGAFAGQSGLVRVTIPSGVTSIGAGAFMNCANLTEVVIPEGVERIGDRAFYGCKALSRVEIPGSVARVGDYAFARCTALESLAIADGVKSIGWFAFAWCNSLADVDIPENVESIGEGVFYKCTVNSVP